MSARPNASICCSLSDSSPALCFHRSVEAWQQGKHLTEILGHRRLIAAREGANHEILGHRQEREHLPAFGYQTYAEANHLVGIAAVDHLAGEPYLADARIDQAADGAKQRELAGAVGTEHSDDAAQRRSRGEIGCGILLPSRCLLVFWSGPPRTLLRQL